MAYKIKNKKVNYKYEGFKLDNSYRLLEERAYIEYGTRYSDLDKKSQKKIAELVAKDVF